MPSPRHSLGSWEQHKDEIIRLFQKEGKTLAEIKDSMLHRGFDASKAQYEAIFKRWHLRRNLSAEDWRSVLQALKFFETRGRHHDLYINGRLLTTSQLLKKQKLYTPGSTTVPASATSNNVLEHPPDGVTFKLRTAQNSLEHMQRTGDIQPSIHEHNHSRRNEHVNMFGLMGQDLQVDEEFGPSSTADRIATGAHFPGLATNSTVPGIFDQLQESFPIQSPHPYERSGAFEDSTSTYSTLNAVAVTERHSFNLNGQSTFDASVSSNLFNSVSIAGPGVLFPDLLSPLQFQASPNQAAQGNMPMVWPGFAGNQLSIPPGCFYPEHDHIRSAQLLLENAESAISNGGQNVGLQLLPNIEELLQNLFCLLPGTNTQDEFVAPFTVMGADDLSVDKFVRLLLLSIVNNFAGLESVPVEAIMAFMSQHEQVQSVISHYFQATPTTFSRALAEQLFKSAIESCYPTIVRVVLKTGLVNPNTLVMLTAANLGNTRRTPIEIAASLRHFEMTKLLLEFGADVNKSYRSDSIYSRECGALECAIHLWGTYQPIDPQFVKLLLDHGAEISETLFTTAIRWGDPELITELMLSVSSRRTKCFFLNITSEIAGFLRNDLAFTIIQELFRLCEEIHNDKCIGENNEEMGKVMRSAARKANLELVQLVFPYVGEDDLDCALAAAVMSGSHSLVHWLLEKGANTDGVVKKIDDTGPNAYTRGITIGYEKVTPLAEAIRRGDTELVALFEQLGALSRIGESGRLRAALCAVVEVGDATYLHKILQLVPNPDPRALNRPLEVALKTRNKDFALILLAAGADIFDDRAVEYPFGGITHFPGRQLICAMLDSATITYGLERAMSHFIAWGDVQTIEDLIYMGVDIHARGVSALVVAIDTRNRPLIKLLFRVGENVNSRHIYAENHYMIDRLTPLGCGWDGSQSYRSPLAAAVWVGDLELVHYLLENGADLADESAFCSAITRDTEILALLCQKFRERYPNGRRNFGGWVLRRALELQNDAILDLCLDAKFDVNQLVVVDYGEKLAALGFVIKKYRGRRLDLVGKLLQAGSDVNGLSSYELSSYEMSSYDPLASKTSASKTALLDAIESKSLPLVELLLAKGADVNKEASLGIRRTPLQMACEVGSYPIVDLLLKHKANVHAAPAFREGANALQLAAKAGSLQIVSRLLECGANVHAPGARVGGRTALEYAAEYGRISVVMALWKAARVPFTIEQCQSAIAMAQKNGHVACAMLVEELSNTSQGLMALIDDIAGG
ncbi:putative Clr5 domain-containing protein [Seiridium cardinale]|uniref:Clr5 domain-containing protein n=1 Tax=Seiridium cardinale TaxID=138064 RepID=A0ABR2XWR9_9PEZI